MKLFTAPLSWLYGLGIMIRHYMFDSGMLKSEEFDIPIITIGNLTVGGTGKTPHAEFFIRILKQHYNVALISRGYKRNTSGFVLATTSMSSKMIGDEPKQIKHKFPDMPVAVCEKRAEGIKRLRERHPEVNLIILDDAFQHRYVEPWLSVLLMDYNNPIFDDHLLPMGRLRDLKSQVHRANFIIVTKCPDDIKPIDMRVLMKKFSLYPYQSLFFTKIAPQKPVAIYPELAKPVKAGQNAIVVSGLANPQTFVDRARKDFNVLDVISYPDHHKYKLKDIAKIAHKVKDMPQDTIILTTEKDSVKLSGSQKISEDIKSRLYYVPIDIEVIGLTEYNNSEEILRKTLSYVKANQKYNMLHPD